MQKHLHNKKKYWSIYLSCLNINIMWNQYIFMQYFAINCKVYWHLNWEDYDLISQCNSKQYSISASPLFDIASLWISIIMFKMYQFWDSFLKFIDLWPKFHALDCYHELHTGTMFEVNPSNHIRYYGNGWRMDEHTDNQKA